MVRNILFKIVINCHESEGGCTGKMIGDAMIAADGAADAIIDRTCVARPLLVVRCWVMGVG